MIDSRKKLLEKIKTATVAIAYMNTADSKQPFTIVGSGFCIDASGVIITCRHVLETMMSKTITEQIKESKQSSSSNGPQPLNPGDVKRPHAIFYDTKRSDDHIIAIPVPMKNSISMLDKDLAALQLLHHNSFQNGYPFLDIEDYKDISEGEDIGVCGFPLGNYLFDQLGTATSSFTMGILSSIIPAPNVKLSHLKGFQLNVTATHGNSGGPIFAMNSGKVFGVLTLGVQHPSGGIVQGLVKAEPVYPVVEEDFIKRLKSSSIEKYG
jgi:S1-C subfamily serine protease